MVLLHYLVLLFKVGGGFFSTNRHGSVLLNLTKNCVRQSMDRGETSRTALKMVKACLDYFWDPSSLYDSLNIIQLAHFIFIIFILLYSLGKTLRMQTRKTYEQYAKQFTH